MHISTKDTHDLTFVDCIIHDSYNDDLVKINSLCHHITFRGCLLFNMPNPGDEIFDINTVTDVAVEDCIMMSDMEGSGRQNKNNNQSLIVIKNSSMGANPNVCKRIAVRRNVFCNWQGRPDEGYVLIGEDAKNFWEAQDVTVENNLFLFNSANHSNGAVTLKDHVRNITIRATRSAEPCTAKHPTPCDAARKKKSWRWRTCISTTTFSPIRPEDAAPDLRPAAVRPEGPGVEEQPVLERRERLPLRRSARC